MWENLSSVAKIFIKVNPPPLVGIGLRTCQSKPQQPKSNSRLNFTKWKTDDIPLYQSSYRDLRWILGFEGGNSPSSRSKNKQNKPKGNVNAILSDPSFKVDNARFATVTFIALCDQVWFNFQHL